MEVRDEPGALALEPNGSLPTGGCFVPSSVYSSDLFLSENTTTRESASFGAQFWPNNCC